MIGKVNIPVWLNSSNSNTCIVLLKKAIVCLIEEYSLSCLCLERLHLRSNKGWVSFRARVINLFFRFRRKMNPKKALTGAR